MPKIHITASCPIQRSFRVEQVAGMFDLSLEERLQETFAVEVPGIEEPWSIGAIVGPSGSGKTTIAKAAFGEALVEPFAWPCDRAILDGFASGSIHEITRALTAVGLGSPPTWIKPYRILSAGERFRCDVARALLLDRPLIAIDEFTSVVDRTVAQVASAAIGQAIRDGRWSKRLVAVGCHRDFLEWLAPDWVVDMAGPRLEWRRLRRPAIRLAVHACDRSAWAIFARHHYLNGRLPAACECYLAAWDERPVAFCAVVAAYGRRGWRRVCRLVTLPDFQGLGIGARLVERVCSDQARRGRRMRITTSHPAMIGYCRKSPLWRLAGIVRPGRGQAWKAHPAAMRRMATFVWRGGEGPCSARS